MKPVTAWYRVRTVNDRKIRHFNHLSDGHDLAEAPTAISSIQANAWKSEIWEKEFRHLDDARRLVP